ncbi:MAG: SurA N-terminal domain-containing protein [Methylococcaceae bacterium]|nr:SurA N-terminal domain-containing protein [Methylococcaceae bacterium]MDZ4155723.1 SurA N-terminal domain-containing protein [Methylococcales bacterium]MDP2391928.1 SurA N-terminal domain-containing protein [Methylococcaceae bacterium]MDP3018833.1 SurA N-terminal domain-containing protein [Methylococcaceae bacterium]MDP3391394.1 SurA N-terminal domain-containing protein [Methylococcaceae bacterium]
MLTKIREKAQGAFAWGILIIICVPFALWGIQNYLDTGKEPAVATVGDKNFYQRDVNNAYEQYRQSLQGVSIDEEILKAQALEKLIKDEVLLQYAYKAGLVASDEATREFITSLPYFQVDGKFDDKRYKALLNAQKMSSAEFVGRIKNAMIMEQFQQSIIDSSFATQYDVESFFKIQNQQRDAEYLTVTYQKQAQPSDQEISAYYQLHQDSYQTPEQVSVQYVELALEDLAKNIEVTEDKLKAFYEDQKGQYTTPERRKISHILFAINDKTNEQQALEKAKKTKVELDSKDFSVLASEVSDDKLTAKAGGDLGLFNAGDMEKAFEDTASALKLGEVSEPVKSSFGYHLIKVTELIPGEVKSFDSVKSELSVAYQKNQAENAFYEAGERLTESSFENPDNLQTVASALNLKIKQTGLLTREHGEQIGADEKIRNAAFSEEVLKGNNSTPIELGADRLVVLRVLEHKPAAAKTLQEVNTQVIAALSAEKAKQQAIDTAKQIKGRLLSGESIQSVAAENKFVVKKLTGLARNRNDIPVELRQEIFKAAKPIGDKPTVLTTELSSGEQAVVSVAKVQEGVMSADDKKQLPLALKNIGKAFGQADFNALINSLQAKADISVKVPK